MSKMYVTEYADAGVFNNSNSEPGTDQAPVTFTGTAGASSAFAGNTRRVRVHVDGIASLLFGTAPTATTDNKRMTAGQTEYFLVPQGGAYKVSAVTNT